MKKSLTDLQNEYLYQTYELEQYKKVQKERTLAYIIISFVITIAGSIAYTLITL